LKQSTAEENVARLGLDLSKPPTPVANYVMAVRTGNLVYVSGHGPVQLDGSRISGKVGDTISLEEGYQAARSCGLAMLRSLRAEIGDLNKVNRVVKLLGMVNAVPEFNDHPKVINGCSDLLVDVFGERGVHARSAVGMGSLPNQIPVEIEMIVEIKKDTEIPD
jgi:enamine deaminase RidA (YjgF/YER057c/UK114 family)